MLIDRADGDREGGAILVFSAVLLLALIAFAALAVDLGNAWSNDQLSQTNSDVAALGALQRVPRTFKSVPAGGPGPFVEAEVQAEVSDLVSINVDAGVGFTATGTPTFVPGGVDVAVDVTIVSDNAFGRAIGAGNSISVDTDATAHLQSGPVDKMLPIGFYAPKVTGQPAGNSQPYQCIDVAVPAGPFEPQVCQTGSAAYAGNGHRNRVLAMTRLNPLDCTINTPANFISGVDHLVDTIALGVRTEANACVYGHIFTLPSAAVRVTPSTAVLTQATVGAGAPLASASPPLWTYLVGGLGGACVGTNFDPATFTLEEMSNSMRNCLRQWNGSTVLFTSGLTSSPRFGWGADILEDGLAPEEFEAPILLFLNTVISDQPGTSPTDDQYLNGPLPAGQVAGATVYSLARGMLSSSDRNGLLSPFGIDNLEFSLID